MWHIPDLNVTPGGYVMISVLTSLSVLDLKTVVLLLIAMELA